MIIPIINLVIIKIGLTLVVNERKRIKLTLINFKKLANGIIEDLHQSIMHIISNHIRIHHLKKKII